MSDTGLTAVKCFAPVASCGITIIANRASLAESGTKKIGKMNRESLFEYRYHCIIGNQYSVYYFQKGSTVHYYGNCFAFALS